MSTRSSSLNKCLFSLGSNIQASSNNASNLGDSANFLQQFEDEPDSIMDELVGDNENEAVNGEHGSFMDGLCDDDQNEIGDDDSSMDGSGDDDEYEEQIDLQMHELGDYNKTEEEIDGTDNNNNNIINKAQE